MPTLAEILDFIKAAKKGASTKISDLINQEPQQLSMEGRANFLPYQDTLPGSVMNQRSWALPGIAAGGINAITAPRRAMQGGYEADEAGNITPTFNAPEEAMNMATNMMGGGIGASRVAPPPAGSLGMNVAPKAIKELMPTEYKLALTESMKNNGPLYNLDNMTREMQREYLAKKAEEFAAPLRSKGFEVSIEQSGSAAGPSFYARVFDPKTNRFIRDPIRFSGHSKGPFNSQFVHEMGDSPDSAQMIYQMANDMRGQGAAPVMSKEAEERMLRLRAKNEARKARKAGKTQSEE